MHSSKIITTSEPRSRWTCIDSSGPMNTLAPSTGEAKVTPSSLILRQGEIVGLAGLNGAGRSTLLKALFGVGRNDSDVELFGAPYRPLTSRQAIRQGVGLVPENRKTEGLLLDAPIYRNACLVHARHLRWFSHRQAKDRAGRCCQKLQTLCCDGTECGRGGVTQ